MSERGVFAVDRGIWDHPMFAEEPFTEREAWSWLIGEASFKARSRNIGGRVMPLERGQLAASVRFMAERWKWSKSRVDRFLKRLKTGTMIETESGTGMLVITICNYDKYQRVSLPDRDSDGDILRDADGTLTGQQRDKREDTENTETTSSLRSDVEREHEIDPRPKRVRAKPRTSLPDLWQPDERDRDYASDRGFSGDRIRQMSGAFANHHRSRGSLMADWNAAWRTWVDNEIKFHGASNGHRTANPRTSGHDAILAVAARKARELDRNDQMAGATGSPGFAFGDGFDGSGSGRDRGPIEADFGDRHRNEPDGQRVREGEVIPPDKNAFGVPRSRFLV